MDARGSETHHSFWQFLKFATNRLAGWQYHLGAGVNKAARRYGAVASRAVLHTMSRQPLSACIVLSQTLSGLVKTLVTLDCQA